MPPCLLDSFIHRLIARPRSGSAVGQVSEDTGSGCGVLLVSVPLSVRYQSNALSPSPSLSSYLTCIQRQQAWPASHPQALQKTHPAPHCLAERSRHAALAVLCAELWQAGRARVPRAAGESVQSVVFQGDMGDYGAGCWVLDCHADPEEVAERSAEHGIFNLLSGRCGTGG